MKEKISVKHLLVAFAFAFLSIVMVNFAIHINPDNDMWWMMATGRYIVEHQALPATNVFVIHEGFDLIVQQWIMAIINYMVYNVAGAKGLVLLALGVFVCNMILLYRLAGHYTRKKSVRLAVLFVGMVLCRDFINTRPALVTMS
ncbi:MAG: hypothetical protein IJF07_08655, partial [Lachnospiraceae bacterium]|nr:hypothetical protein [Lachnospiraceae bacterium]